LYRLQEFMTCQGTSNYLDLLRVECIKKGEKLSGLHKGFTGEERRSIRFLQAVTKMKWHQGTVANS